MALRHAAVTERREDFSRFMVHLTRDDRKDDPDQGAPARENFDNILLNGRIVGLRPHTMYRRQIPDEFHHLFRVCCFTETPLDQIHHLVDDVSGRQVKLQPYGFVFSREFLLRKSAQHVTHVNSYGGSDLRDGYDAIFENALKWKFKNKGWRALPFVSAMHGKYDFSWEREWRIRGDLEFLSDLECVIIPDASDEELAECLAEKGIPYICPGWTYEQIVLEISRQMRDVKTMWKQKASRLAKALKR